MNKKTLSYIVGLILALNVFGFLGWKLLSGNQSSSFDKAQALFAQGEYQQFIDKTSNDTSKYQDLVYRRGLSYLRLGEFDESLDSMIASYKVLKSNVNVGLMKALGLFQKGDYESVEATLKPLGSPNIFEQSAIQLIRGINFYHQNDLANAAKFLNESIKGDPISPVGYHYLGRITFDQQKRAQASNYFSKAKSQGYDSLDQSLYLANTALMLDDQSDPEEFIGDLSDIQIKDLEDPSIYYSTLALIARSTNDSALAIEAYTQAIESDPANQLLYTQLGKIYLDSGDSKNALLIFQQGYSFDETNTNILVDQYIAMKLAGVLDDELFETYDKLLKAIGVDQAKYQYLAQALYDNKFYDEAQPIIKRLLTINKTNGTGLNIKRNIIVQNILGQMRDGAEDEIDFGSAYQQFSGDAYLKTVETALIANQDPELALDKARESLPEDAPLIPLSDILSAQLSYSLLEGLSDSGEIANEYANQRMLEKEQAIIEHELAERTLDEVFLEFQEGESQEAYEERIVAAQKLARDQRIKNTPIIDYDQESKEQAMLDWLVAGYTQDTRDTSSQSSLEELDFRFGEDDFLYDQAHALLGAGYQRLVPFYDHIDTLFVKNL